MDIIQRNFLRLLRHGAFGQKEAVEPMSEWKWEKLYQISRIHGVTPWIADAILQRDDDFFLQLSPTLRQQFYDDNTERYEEHEHEELTNPLLNARLQKIAAEAGDGNPTYELLLNMLSIARYILTQGISLRHLIMLGTYLRTTKDPLDYEQLKQWIRRLRMERMAQLEGALLKELFLFSDAEIRFTDLTIDKSIRQVVNDIFQLTQKNAANWYFTQGKSIFVRSSDSDAMFWHVKHSAKYMQYYPSEAVTNFLSNFAHSLSHIEE